MAEQENNTVIQAINTITADVNGLHVRTCELGGEKYAAVNDLIGQLIESEVRSTIHSTWQKLKETYGAETYPVKLHSFGGKGSKPIEVVDKTTVITIMNTLLCKRSDQFRLRNTQLIIRLMTPDQELIDSLQDIHDQQQEGAFEALEPAEPTDEAANTLAIPRVKPRMYYHTNLYVRIRVPDDYVMETENPKPLTMQNMKFGIAYSMSNRHNQYVDKPDNGFMAFSFPCDSREDAVTVETILRRRFKSITVYNSHEYIDCAGYAFMQGTTYDMQGATNGSYESYLKLAQGLFAFMVQIARNMCHDKYSDTYGQVYSISGGVAPSSYPCTTISKDLAMKMGIIVDTHKYEVQLAEQAEDIERLKNQIREMHDAELAHTRQSTTAASANKQQGERRANVVYDEPPVVARNIATGKETTYSGTLDAARAIGIEPLIFKRNLLDKHRQYGGSTYRTKGREYWVPPANFVYDANSEEFVVGDLIKATNGADVRIYEGPSYAAKYLHCTPNNILKVMGHTLKYAGFFWTTVHAKEATWVMPEEDIAPDDNGPRDLEDTTPPAPSAPVIRPPVTAADTGINGRCRGKVIERDLKTGVEVTYESISKAARAHRMSPTSLAENFIDQPRQAYGKHFRMITTKRYWSPPPYFVYDATKHIGKKGDYIITLQPNGGEMVTKMYECIKSAEHILKIPRWGMSDYKNVDQMYKGYYWRTATEEQYNVFVACP